MLVAITGATGFIGHSVQAALLKRGHTLRLLTRPGRSRRESVRGAPSQVAPERVETFAVDPRDKVGAARALRGAGALIHLVGIIAEHGDQTFDRVHPGLTGDWLAAARSAGVPRWLHMSALGTRAGARSRYHRSKWAAEELVRASGGPVWTVFRPSIVHGRHDAFTHLFERLSRWSPVLPLIGGGHGLMQPIAVEQVAMAFAVAVDHPGAVAQTWDLCGSDRLPMRDILRLILRLTGRRRGLVTVPWPVARCQATVLEFLFRRVLGKPSPLSRDQLIMLAEDNVGDGRPADLALGLQHRPFADALAEHLK